MFGSFIHAFVLLITFIVLVGCSGNSGGNNDAGGDRANKPIPEGRIDWSTIPNQFNPTIEDTELRIDGFSRIYFDMFSFNRDVEVIYSDELPAGFGLLRLYKVWAKQASWGGLDQSASGNSLRVRNYGQYQCAIQVRNRRIAALEGGCYVRLQIVLPAGSKVEAYNVGKLITKRFIPITVEEFLEQIDRAPRVDEKFVSIENFLASYKETGKSASLTSQELGQVVGEFMRSDDKFKALRRLHLLVGDRENLDKMIEDKFGFFDREEARRIVGLP